MKVYIMRHGQTVWNSIGKIQGWSKNRLSQLGKEQVKATSEQLKNEKIDVIFSSPLMRTMQTANIMNQPHKVKIVKDNRLIEKKKSIFVGRFRNTLTDEEKNLRKENPKACGEETFEEIFARIKDFADELREGAYKDKIVLIVTHLYTAQILFGILKGLMEKKEIEFFSNFKNAEVRMIEV